jgi:hypothetical protein
MVKAKMNKEKDDKEPPLFDEQLAASFVGKYILVGLTRLDHQGNELRRQQLHGVITSATRKGIQIELRGVYEGEKWNMPPDLRAICPAKPGNYTLHMTKEVVENPDLLSTWTITEPPPYEKPKL